MKIDTEGTYTLRYTAEDECGNVTTEDRTVNVINITYSTVLFTDGTFIINEKSIDRDANIALHGAVTNEYRPFDPNGSTDGDKYIFNLKSSVYWNAQRASILSVEIGSEISPTSVMYWFESLANCTSMDLAPLDTSNVTSMIRMFSGCKALSSLDLSSFDTSNATDMGRMFYACNALTSVDLSSFDTSNVTTMVLMFGACKALPSVDVSNFNTSKVTDMNQMFYACNALTSIDLSTFDTSNVTNMGGMFDDCFALTSIDLSTFDTSNVTGISSMFEDCSALASVDLSSFDTSNVTSCRYMFRRCTSLATIYASSAFDVTQVESPWDQSMFSTMSSNLVGGAGTTWNSSKPTGKAYAHIDGGTSNPGYFTAKS